MCTNICSELYYHIVFITPHTLCGFIIMYTSRPAFALLCICLNNGPYTKRRPSIMSNSFGEKSVFNLRPFRFRLKSWKVRRLSIDWAYVNIFWLVYSLIILPVLVYNTRIILYLLIIVFIIIISNYHLDIIKETKPFKNFKGNYAHIFLFVYL